jgi:hypothetical protein
MARYIRKIPPADKVAARSWIGKFIRDTKLQELGLVHDVVLRDEGLRLLARFPGESVSRPIALETTADMEHLLPGDVRARYRPPTAGDRELLKGLAAKPHGAPGRNVAGRQSR